MRAGNGSLKNDEYTSFIAAKSFISLIYTVVFNTLSIELPAASSTAEIFDNTCFVCSLIPDGISDDAGEIEAVAYK